jgi:hypothetical protein
MLRRVSRSAARRSAGSGGILIKIVQAPVRALGVLTSAIALLVSGLAGGLEPAAPPGPPPVDPKTVSEGLPWNVTVDGAGYAESVEPLRPTKDGDHWIVVAATVEVTADESRLDVTDALNLVGIPGLRNEKGKPSRVLLSRDNSTDVVLHPGLPEKLLFFWELAGDAQIPVKADVQIISKTLRPDSLSGHKNWLDDEARARVILPVKRIIRPVKEAPA